MNALFIERMRVRIDNIIARGITTCRFAAITDDDFGVRYRGLGFSDVLPPATCAIRIAC